jgi:DNA-binding PadR family transcriptional regulator
MPVLSHPRKSNGLCSVEKGFLTSGLGGATAERGGRRKRFYAVTAAGSQALQEIQQIRAQLWSQVHPQVLAI